MSIPNEALQKLLQEIEQKAAQSQQQIAIVKAQIAGKTREERMIQLTTKELSAVSSSKVYEGVGKMFILSSTSTIGDKLSKQSSELKADSASLGKKLHYLETTAKNSQQHIEKMLQSGVRG